MSEEEEEDFGSRLLLQKSSGRRSCSTVLEKKKKKKSSFFVWLFPPVCLGSFIRPARSSLRYVILEGRNCVKKIIDVDCCGRMCCSSSRDAVVGLELVLVLFVYCCSNGQILRVFLCGIVMTFELPDCTCPCSVKVSDKEARETHLP